MIPQLREVLQVGKTSVYSVKDEPTFFFLAGMAIDADGAPKAYHPKNIGLDYLGNAGKPGNWWGIVTDSGERGGTPIVQGQSDPAPGYHVSSTSLCDSGCTHRDPRRYVDSSTIPYIALPPEVTHNLKVRLGDVAVVLHRPTGKYCCAIFADGGPHGHIGEGSIALAEALGIPSSPKRGGTSRPEIAYLLLPQSGNGWPMTAAKVHEYGESLLGKWGGVARLQERLAAIPASRDLEEEEPKRKSRVGKWQRPMEEELFGG